MKKLVIILAILPFVGVLFNIVYQVQNDESVLSLFKYFTILSNLFVGFYFLGILSGKYKNITLYSKLFGSVLISITVTFIVYFGYLEWTYDSEGFNVPASLLNHYITPLLTITYFLYNKEQFDYRLNDMKVWLVFPVLYLVFLLIHGVITDDYIYPFFQVNNVGVLGLLISIILLVLFFVFMSFLVVKILSKNKKV